MELLANITDPRISLSVLMLQLRFKRPKPPAREVVAPPRSVRLDRPPFAHEISEEPERWDGLS